MKALIVLLFAGLILNSCATVAGGTLKVISAGLQGAGQGVASSRNINCTSYINGNYATTNCN